MRTQLLVALGVSLAAPFARAEPRLEASGFLGVGLMASDAQLGDSWAPEQVPGNAALFGLRLGFLLAPNINLSETQRFQIGIEGEGVFAHSHTRSANTDRMSYYAPVFGWRAQSLFRYIDTQVPIFPHLVVGGGGATVAAESPYMRKETDPSFVWGGGVSLPLAGSWVVRVDARHVVLPRVGGGVTSAAEIQFGMGATFGVPEKRTPASVPLPPRTQPVVDETDSDRDGLPDRIDRCPAEKETVNGLDDGDGCPEPDADADRVVGDADSCPGVAEDLDGFADDDGCPEADNDGDGFDDTSDKCPNEAETRNAFDDEDGCPDGVPPEIAAELVSASTKITFDGTRARVTDRSKKALAPILELLAQRRSIRIAITGHSSAKVTSDLARRRADAVKWYLVDQGAAEGRIVTQVAAPGTGPAVELTLILE